MITIDMDKAIPAALATYSSVITVAMLDVAEAIRTEIIRLAGQSLHSSAEEYIQGVQPVKFMFRSGILPKSNFTMATIVLAGWLPNAMEQGWAGGDMKPGLLAGSKAKTGKSGKYTTISFRHGTPLSRGRSFPAMGSAYGKIGMMSAKEARNMGKYIHEEAKKLTQGERLPKGLAPKLQPHHTTDIYAGMVRREATTGKTTQSTYSTFRRVSTNSLAQSWIHPGISPHHLFDAGAAYADKAASFLISQAINNLHAGAGK